MTAEKHNGWTNRETWLVNLWLTNDEPIYLHCRELAVGAENAMHAGELIREWMTGEDGPADTGDLTGFHTDLVNAALARVDWREIGESFRAD